MVLSLVVALAAPAIAAGTLPEKLPADTILYVGWPGRDALAREFQDTAMAKILAEPGLAALRAKLLPEVEEIIKDHLSEEKEEKAYASGKALLGAIYSYPTAIALVSVDARTAIPLVDAAIIVQAGEQSAALAKHIDLVLENADMPMGPAKTVKVGKWEMKELAVMGPAMSVRWGVIDDSLVVTFGNKVLKHLVPGYLATSSEDAATEPAEGSASEKAAAQPAASQPAAGNLADNPSFKKALSVTGASATSPIVFVNLKSIIHTLDAFQPMLASFKIPVLGEEGGLNRVLTQWGLQNAESLSITWTAEAGGLKTTTFLHSPGFKGAGQPLTDADLAVIPKNAAWASASNMDIAALYNGVLNLIKLVSADAHETVVGFIGEAEERMGLKMAEDVVGAFGDTWIIYDQPDSGSLLGSGMTLVADVKPNNRLDAALRKLVEIIAEESNSKDKIGVHEQTYRDVKIAYMNFVGLPVPVAPAWAQHDGRLIVALFPQMVQTALDQMLDKAPSIVEDDGFQRGRKIIPAQFSSIGYLDSPRGMRHLYSVALPISQALVSMGQEQELDLDISLLPSLPAINRHVFDNVTGAAVTPDGYLAVSYGAVPAALPALGQNVTVVPLLASIMLPSLARARELSKRTVSAANLRGIGMAMQTYATSHDDTFPPDLQTLVKEGTISDKTLVSPNDENPGEEGSYIYIAGGQKAGDIDADTIVAYEKPDLHGGEGTNALFADGHVDWMMMPQFDEALERSKENLKIEDSDEKEKPEGKDEDESTEDKSADDKSEGKQTKAKPDDGGNGVETKLTVAVVASSGPIAMAIDTYRLDVGQYPTRLEDLVTQPQDETAAEKWNGPYIKKAASLKDPWGRPLKYLRPGEINVKGYDLWSVGPDGKSGTEDDIGNFKGAK
jgi:general secretion pathway protein G